MRPLVLAAAVALLALCGPARAATPLAGFHEVRVGPGGGAVWEGRIPNRFALWDRRDSAVYLPPGYSASLRYPVVYLLHGLAGRPSSFYASLNMAQVADELILSGQARPFIGVMPVAGARAHQERDEWAGVWESYVVEDVVPWVDAHLPTTPNQASRTLAGLCAGGYGAVDIGLRHPGIFGTLESWEGYFVPFDDGPFVGRSHAFVAAHSPTVLAPRMAGTLRAQHVRFFLSHGGNHGQVLGAWTVQFAHELDRLHVESRLWTLPPDQTHRFWIATFPDALSFAAPPLFGLATP